MPINEKYKREYDRAIGRRASWRLKWLQADLLASRYGDIINEKDEEIFELEKKIREDRIKLAKARTERNEAFEAIQEHSYMLKYALRRIESLTWDIEAIKIKAKF